MRLEARSRTVFAPRESAADATKLRMESSDLHDPLCEKQHEYLIGGTSGNRAACCNERCKDRHKAEHKDPAVFESLCGADQAGAEGLCGTACTDEDAERVRELFHPAGSGSIGGAAEQSREQRQGEERAAEFERSRSLCFDGAEEGAGELSRRERKH